MTQLVQVTIGMLLFGAAVFSLALWAAKKHDALHRPTNGPKK
jgi:hypothetical protein